MYIFQCRVILCLLAWYLGSISSYCYNINTCIFFPPSIFLILISYNYPFILSVKFQQVNFLHINFYMPSPSMQNFKNDFIPAVVGNGLSQVQSLKKINLVDLSNCSSTKWNCSGLAHLHNLLIIEANYWHLGQCLVWLYKT